MRTRFASSSIRGTCESTPYLSAIHACPLFIHAAIIKQRCPETGVILLTGFGGGSAETEGVAPCVDMVLGKPATSVELRRAIGQFMK